MHQQRPSRQQREQFARQDRSALGLRLLFAAGIVLLLLLAGTPEEAAAHGGNFMPPPPGPPPPPPMPPPPPPPVTGPPPTRSDPPPTHVPPPITPGGTPKPLPGTGLPPPMTPTTPTAPTGPGPRTGTGGRPPIPGPSRRGLLRGSRTGSATNLDSQWQTWWTLNRLGQLPDRTHMLRHAVVTPTPDSDGTPYRTHWARKRALLGERQVVPLLLHLLDPQTRSRDDVVASALLALGKVARDPALTEILNRHLMDRRAARIVRESAALALGLLSRTERELQPAPQALDRIRDHLLVAFDDVYLHDEARAFAALSLGLLGSQPFPAPYGKDGRLVVRALWKRLADTEKRKELTVALLTALGMQPAAGVPDAVREGLRRIVTGRRELGRRWDPAERSHALTALLRLGGADAHATLLRVVGRKREHVDLRRAAYLAIPERAAAMTTAEREELARMLVAALKKSRDPCTTGLGQLALGQVLGADLRAGSDRVLFATQASGELLAAARNGPTPTRGFSALALALALKDVEAPSREVGLFLAEASDVLLRGLAGGRGDDTMRAAFAVAVGIASTRTALGPLTGIVADRKADPALRGHAAVSLGLLGRHTPDVERVLFGALSQRRDGELRRQAALGLALLGGRAATTQLLKELENGKTEQLLAQVVIALGRLGDLRAVSPLTVYATDVNRSELAQALAVVALGMLADPQPRPTLLRLNQHANYPARTRSLHEAFTIL